MSEYGINCKECGCYIGMVHATEWSENYICDECRIKKINKQENKEND